MFKKRLIKLLGIDYYIQQVEELKAWKERNNEELQKLNNEVEDLKKANNSLLEEIGKIKNELSKVIEDVSEIKSGIIKKDDILDRLKRLENRLDDLEKFHSGIVRNNNMEATNIEDMILGILSMRNDITTTELLQKLNISNRKFYEILSKLESSGKIERRKMGRKVYVRLKR